MPCCLLAVLALLIGHSARGLTGGLAGGLALAATAVGGALLQSRAVERLNMLHSDFPSQIETLRHYTIASG